MMMNTPCAASIPAISAAPYPRCCTDTTRAPSLSAMRCDPSVLPLSATRISPEITVRLRKPEAFAMQVPIVSASLRHGISMVSSRARSEEAIPSRTGDTEAERSS